MAAQAAGGRRAMGAWRSPITAEVVVKGAGAQPGKAPDVRLAGAALAPDGRAYWLEQRPGEGGRSVIVGPGGEDLTPAGAWDCRTLVHEYGGGAWKVLDDSVAVFSDFRSQRVFRQPLEGGEPSPLTPDVPERALRFADFALDRRRSRLLCVMEDHRGEGEAKNSLAAIPLDGSCAEPTVLAAGFDFYAAPSVSLDGKRLAYMTWNHPAMPWTETEIRVADLGDDGVPATTSTEAHHLVAGGPGKPEAPQQPQWTPNGDLVYVSDAGSGGWWNLYRHSFSSGTCANLLPLDAELGGPLWRLGMESFAVLGDDRFLVGFSPPASSGKTLAVLEGGRLEELACPYATFGSMSVAQGEGGDLIAVIGGSADAASQVAVRSPAGGWEVLKRASELEMDQKYFSSPRKIQFPSKGGRTSHMWYYAPRNDDHKAEEGERPPLLVKIHGGPTSAASPLFNLTIQFWTSRGFAVADVDFGGSTGYGREYRYALEYKWGVVDVEDAASAAAFLAEQGLADPKKLAIDGGSAGGFTTLAALTFTDTFTAGCCCYGISDLEILAADTHKFESRYLDFCIGPYPEERDRYKARSPLNHLDKISSPILLLHGAEDKVCPPRGAVAMYDKAVEKGLPAALEIFEGEQHGFRREENILRALDAEYNFYCQVWGMEDADFPDGFQAVDVKNL